MRLVIALGGTVLLGSTLQGCQSMDSKMARDVDRQTFPDIASSQTQTEQRPDLKAQAHVYAARLKRDGCVKSREGTLFEAASESVERELAALKQADNQLAKLPGRSPVAEMATTLAEARLEVGDAASASGCLDIANAQYRAVIRAFPGTVYASYRQRAELGLSASQL